MSEHHKKDFHKLSTLAQFHLAPDLFGEEVNHPFIDTGIDELRILTNGRINQTVESTGELDSQEAKHLFKMIKTVNMISMKPEKLENEKEKQKLELCKKRILNLLDNLMISIEEYIVSILMLDEASRKLKGDDLAKIDHARKMKHDTLIDNINILNRSLHWWFGDFDPSGLSGNLEKMYEKQEEKFISYDIERINIPANGICPPGINLKEREQISIWAKNIYADIASIRFKAGTNT